MPDTDDILAQPAIRPRGADSSGTDDGAFRASFMERVLVVFKIGLILFGDAAIFALWLAASYGIHHIARFFEGLGVSDTFADFFVQAAHTGTFLVAVGYVACDVVGVVRRILDQAKRL